MAPFQILFAETSAEVAARTGLEGRELKAATYDYMAECCETMLREEPTLRAGPCAIYVYRGMARMTRTGEIA